MKPRNGRASGGGYDAAKDKIVQTFWTYKLDERTGLRLVVRRYDGGAPKIAVEECYVRRDGTPGSKSLPRVAAKTAMLPGFLDAYSAAAAAFAAVESERKSAPPVESERAFDLFDAE